MTYEERKSQLEREIVEHVKAGRTDEAAAVGARLKQMEERSEREQEERADRERRKAEQAERASRQKEPDAAPDERTIRARLLVQRCKMAEQAVRAVLADERDHVMQHQLTSLMGELQWCAREYGKEGT